MNKVWDKVKGYVPALPAVAVAVCVGISLGGYEPDEAEAAEASSSTIAEPSEESVSSSSETTAKGSFDVADGVYKGSAQGYSGLITVQVTVKDKQITDIQILSESDTDAFFNRAKAVIDEIIDQQSLDVDVVSGATYSSNGIINAVKNALGLDGSSSDSASASDASSSGAADVTGQSVSGVKDGTYTGSGRGFSGTTTVSVTISGGKITAINILSHGDTPSYFNRAKAVINKIIAAQSTDVDVVSGATYSSRGIIAAVNSALDKAKGGSGSDQTGAAVSSAASGGKSVTSLNASTNTVKDTSGATYKDGTYTGTGTGFGGEMTVSVTISGGRITAINVLSNKDTPSYFNRAKTILNTMIAKQTAAVDGVSGATFSSNGLKAAVSNALQKAVVSGSGNQTSQNSQKGNADSGKKDNDKENKDDKNKTGTKGTFDVADGTYEGSAQGFSGLVTVKVTVKDRQITAIDVVSESDTDAFFNQAKAVIAEILSTQSTDVDTVSGATYSSNGIINAVKNALGKGESDDKKEDDSKEKEEDDKKGNSNWKDGTYTGSGKGFSGTVSVSVTISGGKITTVNVLSNEDTASFFSRAEGVIDEVISAQSTDVDTISGATYSSRGILSAISSALDKAGGGSGSDETGAADDGQNVMPTPVDDSGNEVKDTTGATYKDGTYTGTGTGFGGEMSVSVTISGGKITSISVLSNQDTAGYFDRATSILDTMIEKQTAAVDGVSGATYSSNGLKSAVSQALQKAVTGESGNDEKKDSGDSGDAGDSDAKNFPYPDGTYEGTGEGRNGDITLEVRIEDSQIKAIMVKSQEEDEAFFSRASQVMKDIVAKQSLDVDTVSGATMSSDGILDAVQNALEKAKAAADGGTVTPTPTDEPTVTVTPTPDPSATPEPSPTTEPVVTPSPSTTPAVTVTPTVTPLPTLLPTVTPEPTVTVLPTLTPIPETNAFQDGDYKVTAVCSPNEKKHFDAYNLTMTVTIRDDKITDIKDISGDGDEDNDFYINRASEGTRRNTGIVEQAKERDSWTADTDGNYTDGIDTVTGATCSSKALLDGINQALKAAAASSAQK